MWGGRFASGPDAIMTAINASIGFDQRLYAQDIAGSRAHAAMLAAQGGGCAICGGQQTTKGKNELSVDHCHTTGMVRGLLCNKCNQALGLSDDEPGRLRMMADYIERSRKPRLVA